MCVCILVVFFLLRYRQCQGLVVANYSHAYILSLVTIETIITMTTTIITTTITTITAATIETLFHHSTVPPFQLPHLHPL